jgi:hypothetical protein
LPGGDHAAGRANGVAPGAVGNAGRATSGYTAGQPDGPGRGGAGHAGPAAGADLQPDAGGAGPPGQPFTLKIGQAITLQGSGLRLEVSGIPEDSRCPQNVTCVWAGRAVVTLAVTPARQPAGTVTVATCCPATESSRARYGGHEVQLLRVLPYPLRHDVAIRPEEYTVELRVTVASP